MNITNTCFYDTSKNNNNHIQGRVDRGAVEGCNTFLKFVRVLTKCVGKISRPNVVGKFGVFYQYPVYQYLSISSPAEIKLLSARAVFKEVI